MIRAAALAALLAIPAHAQREVHPLSSYVDSAALHAAIAAAPEGPRSLYWIQFDSTGALEEVRSMDCSGASGAREYREALAGLLRTHARPVHETRKATGVNVWLTPGPSARVQVARRVREDLPSLANLDEVADTMERVTKRLLRELPALRGRMAEVTVKFQVDEKGVPAQSRILTQLGIPEIDDGIHDIVDAMRFRPAMINRCPVPVLVEVPIHLEFR
ncbi:MAG TPA: energy transducer TonB [Longimicrobium sp.]